MSPTKTSLNKSSLKATFRRNMKRIMHFRNVYVFLANVSDQILTPDPTLGLFLSEDDNQLVCLVLVKKILEMADSLMELIDSQECPLSTLENWAEFKNSEELAEIKEYIGKEADVFSVFSDSITPGIKKKFIDGEYGPEVKELLTDARLNQKVYEMHLKKYARSLGRQVVFKMLSERKVEAYKSIVKHLEFALLAIDPKESFEEEFDFTEFYEKSKKKSVEESLLRVEELMGSLL